jgi:hypothetical protein
MAITSGKYAIGSQAAFDALPAEERSTYAGLYSTPALWAAGVGTVAAGATCEGVVIEDVSCATFTIAQAVNGTLVLKSRTKREKITATTANTGFAIACSGSGTVSILWIRVKFSGLTVPAAAALRVNACTAKVIVCGCSVDGNDTYPTRLIHFLDAPTNYSATVSNCIGYGTVNIGFIRIGAVGATSQFVIENNNGGVEPGSAPTGVISARNNFSRYGYGANPTAFSVFAKCASVDATGSEPTLRNLTPSTVFVNTTDPTHPDYYRPKPTKTNPLRGGVTPTLAESSSDLTGRPRPQGGVTWIGAKQAKYSVVPSFANPLSLNRESVK